MHVIIGILSVAAVGLFLYGATQWRRWRWLSGTKASSIATLGPGLAVIQGKATPLHPMISPKAKSPCLYYRYIHQRFESRMSADDEENGEWTTPVDDERATDFILDDGTAKALVLVSGAELEFDSVEPPAIELTSVSVGGVTRSVAPGATRDFETVVAPGRRVCVIGSVTRTAPGSAGADAQVRVQFGVGEKGSLFVVSDKPRAGLAERFKLRLQVAFGGSLLLVAAGVAIIVIGR